MAEVTAEMGAELRASAMAAGTSVAAEVGRRLERLDRLEATVERVSEVEGLGWLHPAVYRFKDDDAEIRRLLGNQRRRADINNAVDDSLLSRLSRYGDHDGR